MCVRVVYYRYSKSVQASNATQPPQPRFPVHFLADGSSSTKRTAMISPLNMLSPNSCANYFKLVSATRRHIVIGCTGYENANPPIRIPETADIGVGCHNEDDGDNVDSCAICFESFHQGCAPQKNIATTECGHTFCLSCLLKNLHTSNLCPLCRAPVEQNVKRVLKPLSYSEGI